MTAQVVAYIRDEVVQLKNLEPQLRRFIFYTNVYESDPVSDVESHSELLDALRSGDSDQAEAMVQQHLTDSGDRLLARLTMLEE